MKEKSKSKENLFSYIKGQNGLIVVVLIALADNSSGALFKI